MSNEDGYPAYRRRSPEDGGNSFTKKVRGEEITITNQFVIPYSPFLCRVFNCHINVELCHSVQAVKYICKYITKGSDACMFSVTDPNRFDEIQRYQLGRYLSASEAAWRIFANPIHHHFPPIEHLAVHLENGQRVRFSPDENLAAKLMEPPSTTLTAFFELNQRDPSARSLLYHQIPQHYLFVNKEWRPRQRQPNLGRIYTIHPRDRECFFLRILLINRAGPTSFEDIRTVDGHLCETYKDACERLGLLQSDDHWKVTLEEATSTMMPKAIRSLFAVMIGSCEMSTPLELWMSFRESMSEDLLHQVINLIQ